MGEIDKERPELNKFGRDYIVIRKVIKKNYKDLLNFLVIKLSSEGINVNQGALNMEVSRYMRKIERELLQVTGSTVTKAFKNGQIKQIQDLYAEMTIEEARKFISGTDPTNMRLGFPNPNYGKVTDDVVKSVATERVKDRGISSEKAAKLLTTSSLTDKRVRALIEDTYGDILLATKNTEPAIKKVIRETVRDIAQYHSLTGQAYGVQANELKKQLTKKGLSKRIVKDGFVGIVDKRGRRWDIGTYSDMVIRTKTNQAYMQGITYQAEEAGLDLAVISSHGAEDACSNWEGVVISLTGKTPGYPTLDDAKASKEIFHPNCKHSFHSIRELDSLHPDDIAVHKSKVGNLTK